MSAPVKEMPTSPGAMTAVTCQRRSHQVDAVAPVQCAANAPVPMNDDLQISYLGFLGVCSVGFLFKVCGAQHALMLRWTHHTHKTRYNTMPEMACGVHGGGASDSQHGLWEAAVVQ